MTTNESWSIFNFKPCKNLVNLVNLVNHTHTHTHTLTHTHTYTHTHKLSAIYQPAPLRFIFNVENKDKFQQSQSDESSRSMLQSLNITIDNILSSNGDAQDQSKITSTVIDTNNKFTEHLRDIAANCFKQTKNNNKKAI